MFRGTVPADAWAREKDLLEDLVNAGSAGFDGERLGRAWFLDGVLGVADLGGGVSPGVLASACDEYPESDTFVLSGS